MSRKKSSRGNACNEDVDGQSVRCKTTCTHFLLKKGIQLNLCKALWHLTGFLEVHTADLCSLPLSRWAWQTNLYHYFAYHVKTSSPHAIKMKFKWGRVKWPCSTVNLTESEKSSRLKQAVYLLWKINLFSLHEQKDMFAKKFCIDFVKSFPTVTLWAS